MTALFLMDRGVTSPANGKKVFQRVISLLSRSCNTVAVNVMNMKVFCASAPLASVIVSGKSGRPVTVKVKVVSGVGFVLGGFFRMVFHPFHHLCNVSLLAARSAHGLWSGTVLKIIATSRALLNGSNRNRPLLSSERLERSDVIQPSKFRLAGSASLLTAASWFVFCAANDAIPLSKSSSCLPVSFESARFASTHVGGVLNDNSVAVWAGKVSVFAHLLISMFVISHYTSGGEYV